MHRSLPLLALAALTACGPSDPVTSATSDPQDVAAAGGAGGLVRLEFPAQDPGAPFYARVGPILNQFFHTEGWLAVPFYRDPACVPGDFNLMHVFDAPGPGGPGAFACPLTVEGFLLIERDAPLGTFPRQVISKGDAVPVWFVRWSDFDAALSDGVVTMDDLRAMNPVAGVARRFSETLHPRIGEHLVVITAQGQLDDGRNFNFHVTHVEDRTTAIQIRFR